MNTYTEVLETFHEWVDDRTQPVSADQATSVPALFNDFSLWAIHHDVTLLTRSTFEMCLQIVRRELFEARQRSDEILGLELRKTAENELPPLDEEPLTKSKITAEQWLLNYLAAGPCAMTDIRGAATKAGFAWLTIRHAKNILGITSPVTGVWELSPETLAIR